MANEVKWIKLDVDMFSNPKIKRLRRLPDGNNILLIWVMLLTMAGRCNSGGMILITQNVPYTLEDLADELGFSIDTVRLAIGALENLGMVSTNENAFCIPGWTEHQNEAALSTIREYEKQRKSQYRTDRKKQLTDTEKVSETSPRQVHGHSISIISYSFNNKSNIENLIYILTNTNYENKDYINNNTELLDVIKEWMTYKDAKKPKVSNHYDTQMGLQKCLTQFVKADKEYGTDEVARVVGLTISQNYQGVLWDKCRKDNNSNGDQRNVKGYDYRDYYGDNAAKYDGNDMPFMS